jgi:hypothetical protein
MLCPISDKQSSSASTTNDTSLSAARNINNSYLLDIYEIREVKDHQNLANDYHHLLSSL